MTILSIIRHIVKIEVGWSRGTSKLSKSIQWADDSYFNHVFIVFTFFGVKIIVESMKHGIQWTPFEHLERAKKAGKITEYCLYELEDLTTDQMDDIYEKALEIFGDGYDFWQILRYLLWLKVSKIFKKAVLKRNNDKKLTCNEAIIYMLKWIVALFKDTDYSYTPELIYRLCHDGRHSKDDYPKKTKPVEVTNG